MHKLDAEIEKLKGKTEAANSDAKINKLTEQLDKLKESQKDAQENFKRLQKSSASEWEDMKIGVEESLFIFNESVKSAVSRFL